MKKVFVEPEIKVVGIEMQDIICTSAATDCGNATNETSVDLLLGDTVGSNQTFGAFQF